jgi:energy-coupling factor transporter ATP-binding protein EcfA2
MLKRVVIENYRSCLRTSIDLHPNLSVLIGPNGSGKTNILQALMFLNKLAKGADRSSRWGGGVYVTSRLKTIFQYGRTSVNLNASVDSYSDESNNDIVVNSKQKWALTRPEVKVPFTLDIPMSAAASIGNYSMHRNIIVATRREYESYLRNRFSLRSIPTRSQEWVWRAMRKIVGYCGGIRYYGASQFTNPSTCPASFEIDREGSRLGFSRSRGHTKILYNMYMASKDAANSGYKEYIDIVGPKGLRLIDGLHFKPVQTSSIDHSVLVGGRVQVRKRHKLLIIPQFTIGSQTLSPNQLSEGSFKTLCLLFYLMTEESTALLIEEPEVCIHHGLLSSILELVKSASRKKQIILSTHSDYVLDHVAPDNVFRVALDKTRGTVARHIRKTMTIKEYSALRQYLDQEGNLGEYWREGGLGEQS